MKYYDYEWDLEPHRILLDSELNVDKLGWKSGDIFKLVNVDGKVLLKKIDQLEKFIRGYSNE
jgi:hypothetical protein